jgi:hypothetical protein
VGRFKSALRAPVGIISHAVWLHQVLQKTGLCRRPRLTIRIRGVLELFWRSVDQRGIVLDVLKGRWSVTDGWQNRSLK